MRIAVISDTHVPASCEKLPAALLEKIRGVDLIIHAGDITDPTVLDELNKIAHVEAVAGNMDSHKVRGVMPVKKVIELEGFKIGIIHGSGHPDNLMNYLKKEFADQDLDCIIYGHSHQPGIEKIGRTLYFNPGSPTDTVFAPYRSFGILEIDDKITARIEKL